MRTLDDQFDPRINEVLVKPFPVSRTPEELDVADYPISHGANAVPVPVAARVRYPETVIGAEGVA